MRRIIVAFERQTSCDKVRRMAESSEEYLCAVCRSGAQLREAAHRHRGEIVVCGFKLCDESSESVYYDLPPGSTMLMLASAAKLSLCESGEILKLATPVSREALLSSLHMLERTGRGHGGAWREPEADGREPVAEAKALLCSRFMMTEAQAHRFLQKRSMDAGTRLSQTARAVIESL